ncbi:hypothetical protein [Duganella vulcania]|uniref:Uncharacterized protein n=1 Tax=Duganella vulcania TaxID=2692166 RepID=A0A845GQP1_9BURK|nr:hypothetical protein [Duganella vulcania]MYM95895.1 hypothetical protein [Duganella vulcania]
MRSTISSNGYETPAVPDHPAADLGDPALCLEELPPGRRFAARDGCRFIRTNLICFGFCDLTTGQLCSARDICARHGGAQVGHVKACKRLRQASQKKPAIVTCDSNDRRPS